MGILAMAPIVLVFRALGSFANAYLMAYTGMHVLEQIRRMVFEHIQSLPLAFFGSNKVGDLMSRVMGDTSQLQGAIVKVVDSLIKESATREVRAYNLEAREGERFGEVCRNLLNKSLKVVKYDKALTPLIELVTSFAIVIALYVAVVNEINEGALASILAALYMCYQPVKKLGAVSNTIRKAEASLDRLEFVLHTKDTVRETTASQGLGNVKGKISMEQVQFKYTDDSVVLDQIQVDIAAGEIVALVGPSGAGKTTFANLVPRFYDVTEGRIRIDVRDVLKSELRNHVCAGLARSAPVQRQYRQQHPDRQTRRHP